MSHGFIPQAEVDAYHDGYRDAALEAYGAINDSHSVGYLAAIDDATKAACEGCRRGDKFKDDETHVTYFQRLIGGRLSEEVKPCRSVEIRKLKEAV